MNRGSAVHQLRKMIMFSMMKQLELDNCFQCGEKMENIDELSVEHKIPWLDSENPRELFFDLDNITFSHLSCNSKAARQNHPEPQHGTVSMYRNHKCRCGLCREANTLSARVFKKRHKV